MKLFMIDPILYVREIERGFSPSHEGDAGIDLRARTSIKVAFGETARIPLGVSVELPIGTVGWLTGRSSSSLEFGLLIHEGKIDSGYRGEVHCICTAQGAPAHIERGERIAQLVVLRIADPTMWELAAELGTSTRGEAGLGSTGRF